MRDGARSLAVPLAPVRVQWLARHRRRVGVRPAMWLQLARQRSCMRVRTSPGPPRGTILGLGWGVGGSITPTATGTGVIAPISVQAGARVTGAGTDANTPPDIPKPTRLG